MVDDDSPVVMQRRLRAEIRRLREAAGLTQREVADEFDWSPSKVIRIETGATNVGLTDLRALLMRYGVTDEEKVHELLQMARTSRRQTWRDKYRSHIESQFYAFLGYEDSAVGIRQLQSNVVPGLLQTQEYVRSLSSAFIDDQERLDRGISIRAERQRVLERQDGPEMLFVLDEAAVRRRVGTRNTMRDQLARIRDLGQRPNITIRIIPFDVDAYRGIGGSFVIFNLSEEVRDRVLFVEEFLRDVMIRDNPTDIDMYSEIFSAATERALSSRDTLSFLSQLLSELS